MALQCEKIKEVKILKDVVLDSVSYTTGQVVEMTVLIYTMQFFQDLHSDSLDQKSTELILMNDEEINEDAERFLLAINETLGYYNLYGPLLRNNPSLK